MKQLNSHFANINLTSKNAQGYANKKTIGAFHLKGSKKLNAQQEELQVKNHEGYVNLELVNQMIAAGEVANNGFLNIMLDENRYFESNHDINFNFTGNPTLDPSKANYQGFVSVSIKSKNDQGYNKSEIIGNLIKKDSLMPNSGKKAFTNFISINLKKVQELKDAGELSQSKYLSFSLFGNKNSPDNYNSQVQPEQVSQAKPQMDDIPF